MYKVFFNEKKIVFTLPGNITLIKPNVYLVEEIDVQQLKESFFRFVESDDILLVIAHRNPEKLFKTFTTLFKVIKAAGGVVFRGKQILCIYRNGRWDLPKGKIDKGEKKREAALREVAEECGISEMKIIRKLETSYHIYCSEYADTKGEWVLKKTFWYEMIYGGNSTGKPQLEEGITQVKWVNTNELGPIIDSTYPNLVDLLKNYRD